MTRAPVVPQETPVTRNTLWRISLSPQPRLRVGVLLDGLALEKCYVAVLDDIRESNFARVELAVVRQNSAQNPSRNARPGLWRSLMDRRLRKRIFYDSYLRVDRRMKPKDDPLDRIDCSALLAGVERLNVAPFEDGSFGPDAVEKIRARNLDVLIRFGFHQLTGEILQAARYGVWSYHHGDNDYYRGGPSHFWELYEHSTLSGVILQMQTGEASRVLCKSLFTTHATISVSVNRFAPYWGSTELVIRKLNELHGSGGDALTRRSVFPAPYGGKHEVYGTPTNSEMARWLGPVLVKKALRYPLRRRTVQHWNIGMRLNARPIFQDPGNASLDGFKWIDSPPGHFWADPFGFEQEGKSWLFFEDYSYRQGRAWISCAEIDSSGAVLSPVICLDNPQRHYSYPYIFRDGGEIYMIPEAYDSGSIDLYRCEGFPNQWARVANIFKGKFVDTSVWQDQGLWWMLTTSADPNPRTACLFLFYAESLTGEWRFHPANPISTDVRNNRGAGRIFRAGERWIRPSQSCCPLYGYSFTLNEINALSTEHYAESPVRTVTPEAWKGLCAVHTYNWVRNIELIDGARMLPLQQVAKPQS